MYEAALRGMDLKPEGALCDRCPLRSCAVVEGAGPAQARIVVVGEAPGTTEVARGEPFVGRAGQLLDRALAEAGTDREEVYVTNAVLCRPWPHRAPNARELAACRGRLLREVRERRPTVVLALGGQALKTLSSNNRASITQQHGVAFRSEELDAWVVPAYHPARVLREPPLYHDLLRDVRRAVEIAERGRPQEPNEGFEYVVIDDLEGVRELCERLRKVGAAAVDAEWGSDGRLLCLGFAWRKDKAVVVSREALASKRALHLLNNALNGLCLVGHNFKEDAQILWRNGLTNARVGWDTLLAHYLLDSRKGVHGLGRVVADLFAAPDYKAAMKPYMARMEDAPSDLLHRYNAMDACYTWTVMEHEKERLSEEQKGLLDGLLIPAANVLARMEATGVLVDREYLDRLDVELSQEIVALKKEITRVAGFEFNPNSPAQLLDVLYNRLELPVVGRISTDREALEAIDQHLHAEGTPHPLPSLILRYRKATKLHATYVRGIRKGLDEEGRAHACFNLNTTDTGRLSSSNPFNYQNIPRPDTDGGRIRNLFIATPGWTLVEADYSQAEIRVMAWFSQDPNLIDALSSGADFHIRTACMMFKATPEEVVEKGLRTPAKRLSFGVLYQMSAIGLAKDLSCSVQEAEDLIHRYFDTFDRVLEWIEDTKATVLRQGYVTTPYGRVRRFDLITDQNRNEVLRQAVNFPVQSVASDLTLEALVRLAEKLPMTARPLLTVHDSNVIEAKGDEESVVDVASAVRETMLDVPRRRVPGVPFEVEVKVGHRWGSVKRLGNGAS